MGNSGPSKKHRKSVDGTTSILHSTHVAGIASKRYYRYCDGLPRRFSYWVLAVTLFALVSETATGRGAAISVLETGAVCDNQHDDTEAISKAVVAAEQTSQAVLIPVGTCVLSAEVRLPAGLEVYGSGPQSRVRQSTWGLAAFRVQGDRVYIHDLALISVEPRTRIQGRFEGTPARGRSAGIYSANSNLGRYERLAITGFSNGISLRGSTASNTRNTGNLVAGLEVEEVDQGVLSVAQQDHVIRGVRSHSITRIQGVDPHLIYLSGAAPPGLANVLVEKSTLVGGPSSGFKANGVEGLTMVDLTCEGCTRGFDIANTTGSGTGLRAVNVVSSPQRDTQQGAFVIENSNFLLIGPSVTIASDDAFGINARGSAKVTVIGGSFRSMSPQARRPLVRTSGTAVVNIEQTTFEMAAPSIKVFDLRSVVPSLPPRSPSDPNGQIHAPR